MPPATRIDGGGGTDSSRWASRRCTAFSSNSHVSRREPCSRSTLIRHFRQDRLPEPNRENRRLRDSFAAGAPAGGEPPRGTPPADIGSARRPGAPIANLALKRPSCAGGSHLCAGIQNRKDCPDRVVENACDGKTMKILEGSLRPSGSFVVLASNIWSIISALDGSSRAFL